MLDALVDAFKKLGGPTIRNDDFFDRLSRRYSMILLGVSFLIITTSHFVGNPIHCFTLMVGSAHKIDYINWVCWISSSYYLPFDQPLPNRHQARPERIPYYQWVPFILFVMMMFFYFPGFIWRKMNRNCGIDTKVITQVLRQMDPLNGDERQEAMKALVASIDKGLKYHREYRHGFIYSIWQRFSFLFCCTLGQHSGNYLAAGYMVVKMLYILNAVGQLLLLNVFMGNRFHLYGLEVLQKWWNGQEIEAVERFPRITMCQFSLRTLGDNIQPYSVQCLLPINIYNEKIFLLIWFWLAFVLLASVYGLAKWVGHFTLTSRKNFVRQFLQANGINYHSKHVSNIEIDTLRRFVDYYCRQDGVLLLRIISTNLNNVITGELICALWEHWQKQEQVPINGVLEVTDQPQAKIVNEFDGNISTITHSRVPSSTIQDDRSFMLSPLRL